MFDLYCHQCDTRYLVGSRSIRSFHNSSNGPVVHATCPKGHGVVRRFRLDAGRSPSEERQRERSPESLVAPGTSIAPDPRRHHDVPDFSGASLDATDLITTNT